MADDSPWSAIANVIGSGVDAWSQSQANAQNRDIWRKNQDWQEMMSNTQYQRAAADMRAAGINPILLASKGMSGASTPTPSAPQMSSITGGRTSALALQLASMNLMKEQAKTEQTKQVFNSNSAKKVGHEAKMAENLEKVNTRDTGIDISAFGDVMAYVNRIVGPVSSALGLAQGFKNIMKMNDRFVSPGTFDRKTGQQFDAPTTPRTVNHYHYRKK